LRGASSKADLSLSSARDPQQHGLQMPLLGELAVAGRLQEKRLHRLAVLIEHRLQLIDAVGECGGGRLAPLSRGEEPQAIFGVREVIAKRRIRTARLDLIAEPLQ
jgi:hypothetical protein